MALGTVQSDNRSQECQHVFCFTGLLQTRQRNDQRCVIDCPICTLLLRGESLNNKPQLTKTRSYSDKLILHNHCSFIRQSHPICSTSARILSVKFLPPPRPRLPSFGHREVPLGGGFYLKLFFYSTGARRNS